MNMMRTISKGTACILRPAEFSVTNNLTTSYLIHDEDENELGGCVFVLPDGDIAGEWSIWTAKGYLFSLDFVKKCMRILNAKALNDLCECNIHLSSAPNGFIRMEMHDVPN